MNFNTIVRGDYVFTPCKNAFNDKVTYWISKKNETIAFYAFTAYDAEEMRRQTTEEALEFYKRLYEKLKEKRG